MTQLIIAATPERTAHLEEALAEATVGRWRKYITFIHLSDSNRAANDAALRDISATHPDTDCYADKNVTTRDLEESGVRRMAVDQLRREANQWLDTHGLSWRGNATRCREQGAYSWMDIDDWRHQFKRVDPTLGPKVATAILAQLRIVGMQEFRSLLLTDGLQPTSHSIYFMGADPHSGDHGVATVLTQCINNRALSEAFRLPKLEPQSSIRMYNDGSWSGGEASQRLRCLYTRCGRKANHIEPSQTLAMHFAFLTDIAETQLQSSIAQIEIDFNVKKGAVTVSCPEETRLRLLDDLGNRTGLAFRDPEISEYVSPTDLEALCKRIGKKIASRRPLGTKNLASTIGFWHSLPKAMLPVLIVGGGPLKDSNGNEFSWRPLIRSQHVLSPEQDHPDYHCEHCSLAPKEK